jgi:hypothetical protein
VHPGGEDEGPNSTNAPARLNRVVVLGTTGSGKSTVAAALAARNGAQHIELDGLNHGPNWTQVAVEQFLSRVEELSAASKWVFDGNYIDRVSRTLWPLADTIVWLDLPLTVILLRIVRRTVERILRRTRLWNAGTVGRHCSAGTRCSPGRSRHSVGTSPSCRCYWPTWPPAALSWCGCVPAGKPTGGWRSCRRSTRSRQCDIAR